MTSRRHLKTVAQGSAMAVSGNHKSELSVAETIDLQDALFSLDRGFIVEQTAHHLAVNDFQFDHV